MVSLCVLEMMCTCTASACSAALIPAGSPLDQYEMRIDAALDETGSKLTGTLLLWGERVNIVLEKQP